MAEEHADRESGAEDFEARESFSGGGFDEELQEYRPIFDPSSTRDAMAEELENNIDSPTAADDDVMLDKESEIDDDQESKEIADESVNVPTQKAKKPAANRGLGSAQYKPSQVSRRRSAAAAQTTTLRESRPLEGP
jgi:hypothetical protein